MLCNPWRMLSNLDQKARHLIFIVRRVDRAGEGCEGGTVNAIQKCHRLRKAEVSPRALTGVQPDRVETSDIGALAGCAGVLMGTFLCVVPVQL